MSDPIRVTRAVRRCPACEEAEEQAFQFRDWMSLDYGIGQGCDDCSDGWVDVPVDEECQTCEGTGSFHTLDCPDCGGSGRRLHDWATGWYWGDEVLWQGRGPYQVDIVDLTNGDLLEQKATLVLSDPSHRPEPMRWKQ